MCTTPTATAAIDEGKGPFNTVTNFSVYAGKGCISEPDARETGPTGNFRSGNMLATRDFGADAKYDKQWYVFGPFDPSSGEDMPEYGGRVFKVIAQGKSGDDGNLYRYFMSSKPDANEAIEGGNAFAFEYSFRLHDDPAEVSHIYPYVDDRVISVKQSNFDWDGDGSIRVVSVAKKGDMVTASGDDQWVNSVHPIVKQELNTSLDIRFIKRSGRRDREQQRGVLCAQPVRRVASVLHRAHRWRAPIQTHHRHQQDPMRAALERGC